MVDQNELNRLNRQNPKPATPTATPMPETAAEREQRVYLGNSPSATKINEAQKLNPNAPKIQTPDPNDTRHLTSDQRDAAEVDRRVREGMASETDTQRNARRKAEGPVPVQPAPKIRFAEEEDRKLRDQNAKDKAEATRRSDANLPAETNAERAERLRQLR